MPKVQLLLRCPRSWNLRAQIVTRGVRAKSPSLAVTQQRHSLAPDANDLPPAERGTDEYERLVEQFVVPTWRAHSPGATAGVAGDWQHAPPADSESGDGRLIEPLKVVSLPRGMERRPRLRLEKVSGYGAAPRRGGPLATLGRPDPSEIHGQLLGPIVIEDDTCC